MPLSNEQIDEAVTRYRREVDRYAKLVDLVAAACRELVADNAIPATVQARAKDPERLRAKLVKQRENYSSVDEVFERLRDLAGVRIVTYVESDRERVSEEVVHRFEGPAGAEVAAVVKDGGEDGKGFYRATHCQVVPTTQDLGPGYENLEDDTCEIQICSLLAHVWNEIEHDLGYKPLSGDLSEAEVRALEALGHQTVAGDQLIVNLLEATDERLAENRGTFQDQWDFVARARKFFPEASDFGVHSGQLFSELRAEGLDTPQKIEDGLLRKGVEEAYVLLEQFHDYIADDDVVRGVDRASSDPLLMALLARHADSVLARHPGGRGKGRPPRIASIARRFLEMQRAENDGA